MSLQHAQGQGWRATGAENPLPVAISGAPLRTRIKETATHIYVGEALPGTAESAPAWRIQRSVIATGDTDWADGDGEFDNVLDDYLTLTYS